MFLAGYAWYHVSGTRSIVNYAHQTKTSFDNAFRKSTENAPKPNEAIQWLKETIQGYTKLIPGAQGYVDSAFDDLEKIHQKHGGEVDTIIKETYDDLKDATKAGASVEAAAQAWTVLQKALKRIGGLAKDAADDILSNHPEIKEKVGGNIEQLKQMGDQYGPEAKKQVDDTWNQVQDIVKTGLSADNIGKIQKLIQEKTEQLKKYGDQAWQKGIEQVGPTLDKYPQVKEFVEKNKDKLQQGNTKELWEKLQKVAKSGDTDEAMDFLKEQVQKAEKTAKDSGMPSSFQAIFGMIPGGDEVGDKFKQLHELYEKRGKEAESLVKGAIEDIKQVLQKKIEEGQKLKDKAESDVKK